MFHSHIGIVSGGWLRSFSVWILFIRSTIFFAHVVITFAIFAASVKVPEANDSIIHVRKCHEPSGATF